MPALQKGIHVVERTFALQKSEIGQVQQHAVHKINIGSVARNQPRFGGLLEAAKRRQSCLHEEAGAEMNHNAFTAQFAAQSLFQHFQRDGTVLFGAQHQAAFVTVAAEVQDAELRRRPPFQIL